MNDVLTTAVKRPRDCTNAEKKEFMDLVQKGEQVDPETLPGLVARAERLVFLYRHQIDLIGVAGIKRPWPEHTRDVFRWARSSEDAQAYPHELGWIYLEKEFRDRGLSNVLVESAIHDFDSNIFATTRTDNKKMRTTLETYTFRVSGNPYPSTQNEGDLLLYTRPSPSGQPQRP
jgi:hypothetical protein